MTTGNDARNDSSDRAAISTGSPKTSSGQDPSSDSGQALRERAEERARAIETPDLEVLSREEARHLVHELRVLQIELEMQNEELRRTQEALEASQARYYDLYNLAPVGYVTLSEEGLILEANLTAATLLGIPRSTLVNQRLTRFIVPEDQDIYYRHRKQLFETGEPQVCELRMMFQDGATFWARLDATLGQDGDGRAPFSRVAMSDITELKRAEKERLRFEQRLHQVQKAESLDRMAGAVAHHFNNKLMVVMGNLDLALDEASQSRELSVYLSEARNATAEAAEMSSLMLAYLGHALPRAEALDLSEVCREVTRTQRSSMAQRIAIKTDIPPHGPTIKAHPALIRQIVANLMINAREAIGENEGRIGLSVRIVKAAEMTSLQFFPADWIPEKTTYACLEVSDTGCGINPEQRDLIFDPFFSTKFPGRGTGLAVVLGAVRAVHGALAVESQPGQGSTFRVFWPLEAQGVRPLMKAEPEAPAPMEGTNLVLVVDDDPHLLEVAEAMLGRLGYTVATASGGCEAVEIFRKRKNEIRLVLLDLTMPGMNGWQTLAALRELRPDIPVILASGYDEAQVMHGHYSELPQAFLRKPYPMAELKETLDRVLRCHTLVGP